MVGAVIGKVTRYQIGVATVPRGAEFGRALARHFRAHSFILETAVSDLLPTENRAFSMA
jgi:hypothetical protein